MAITLRSTKGSALSHAEMDANFATPWKVVTSAYTAIAGDKILANTTGGAFTVTLPATPTTGTYVSFADMSNWSVNNLTVARNGSTIESLAEDLVIDIKGIRVDLVYSGTTWEAFTFASPSVSINNDTTTNTTQYPAMSRSTSGALSASYVSSTKLYFNPSTGALNATSFNSLSDLSLKSDIQPILNASDLIDQINPVSFTWKDNGEQSYGVIAQEIEKILPNVVSVTDGTRSVSYTQLIPMLIQAVKELKQQVKQLKGE